MTKKEMLLFLKNLKDNEEIKFYVFDAEYDIDTPYDEGYGKVVEVEEKCITLYIHYNKESD